MSLHLHPPHTHMQVRPGLLLLRGPGIAFFLWRRLNTSKHPASFPTANDAITPSKFKQTYETTLHKHQQSMETSILPSQTSVPAVPSAGDDVTAPSTLISVTSTNHAPPTSTPPRRLPLLPPTSPLNPSSSTADAFAQSTPCKTPRTSDDDDGGGFSTPVAPTTGALHSTGSALHHNHHRRHSHCLQHSPSPSPSQSIKPDAYEGRDHDQDCPICMSPLASRSIYKTRCSHRFHKSCLVESRAAHINGCPFCRGEITPGLTPFEACLGRVLSEREQIISRARTARQAVLARMQIGRAHV